MMVGDSDIQAWLETVSRTQPSLIVPYVKSNADVTLRYEVRATKEGAGGKSMLTQGGNVTLSAGQAAKLGSMTLSRQPGDLCSVVLSLYQKGKTVANYRFDCRQTADMK